MQSPITGKMKKRIAGLIIIIMGISAVFGAPRLLAGEDETVRLWHRIDIVLRSSRRYDNPYADVDVDAVFTHEDGDRIALYGFWNGGDEWRVRFAPTKTGRWDYEISCSDADNDGLNGVKGSVIAVENQGDTALDRHGFVRVSDSGRYFAYSDGTPFFWLGDTNWQAPNYVSITKCNYPGCGCSNQFRHEVEDRIKKGFTVYQTYFDGAESDGGGQRGVTDEPSMWKTRHTEIDPETFSEKYDKMFDYLADRGMVIALGFGVHSNTVASMSREALERLSRYLTARYASYPVIWITAQEITGDEQFDAWVRSAEITDAGDGYRHPHSAHQFPMAADNRFVNALNGMGWHGFFLLQNGHGPSIPKKSTYRGYWQKNGADGKPKPFLESEANYEDIYCGGFNGYEASRVSAWKSVLCGSCGFTYGVTGIWANCYSTSGNTGWLGTYSTEPWYMGLDKPGSYEVGYMAEFFTAVGFESLIPRFDDAAYSDFSDERKVLASTGDGGTAAAYFYNNDRSTGVIRGLKADAAFRSFWFDPLTGRYIAAGENIHTENGEYRIPEKPNGGDWVFLITDRTDFRPEKTGTMPVYAPAPEPAVNLLLGAKADAGSFSAAGSEPSAAIDGKQDSWWCASDGSFPQWISFDMGGEKAFSRLSLRLYPGTSSAVWTVEISSDGDDWKVIRDNERQAVDPGNGAIGGYLGGEYTARFIRVTFGEVVGNWAAVVEAEASLSDEEELPLPEYVGSIQKPEIVCNGSAVYSADGRLGNSVSCLTDGDPLTEWKPFAPESTQTITLYLGGKKPLSGANIALGTESAVPDIRIEGSDDGEDWTILADTKTGGRKVYRNDRFGDRNVLSEELTGEYSVVRLLVFGVPGRASVKTISSIELYASDGENDGEAVQAVRSAAVTETGEADDVPADSAKPGLIDLLVRNPVLSALAGAALVLAIAGLARGKKKRR